MIDGRRLRPLRHPRNLDRSPAQNGRERSDLRLQQRRRRRDRARRPARNRPDQEDDLELCRREQDFRAASISSGKLELEFNPQGTMAERIRAGGAGIPAFFTRTGVGTIVAEGKEIRDFNNEAFVMETGLVADISLVHAWKGDTEGNLVYRKTARNFNPMMATAGRLTIAEVEHLVAAGRNRSAITSSRPASSFSASFMCRTPRSASRAARRASATRPDRGDSHGLDPRPNGGARRQGAEGRLLRQSRHRHSDARLELHSRRA